MSWPSKMQHGVMIMGEGLSPAETRWPLHGNEHKEYLCSESVISTDFYPMGSQGTFDDAEGWANLPEGEEPLEMNVRMHFKEAIEPLEDQTWHCLAGRVETTMTAWPFAQKRTTPRPSFHAAAVERTRPARLCCEGRWPHRKGRVPRQAHASDDAEEFKLYISGIAGRCGFIAPAEAAAQIDFSKHITANDIGLVAYLHGIIDTDTVCELVDFHSAWLWNTIESLIKANADWDLCYMHSHPIDWFYHGWLSELDSTDDAVRTKAEKDVATSTKWKTVCLAASWTSWAMKPSCACAPTTAQRPSAPSSTRALKEAGLCSYEPKKSENYWDIYEETEGFNYVLDVSKSLAVPQRYMFVYVNLKGRYPGGIVEQEDYENVRDRIINALLDYKHPDTGDRPVLLAVRKEDAHVFGMGGAQAGDVVYVLKPEYMAEHGYGLPTGESGCGSLKNLLMFRGPNIRKGYRYTRPRWLADIVPTFCYITGNPVPADAEGAPI